MTMPGHGLYVSLDQQRPELVLMILANNFGSRPSLQHNIKVSAVYLSVQHLCIMHGNVLVTEICGKLSITSVYVKKEAGSPITDTKGWQR